LVTLEASADFVFNQNRSGEAAILSTVLYEDVRFSFSRRRGTYGETVDLVCKSHNAAFFYCRETSLFKEKSEEVRVRRELFFEDVVDVTLLDRRHKFVVLGNLRL